MNADEAAVLGAALHGASLSRSFKTKDIKLQDISLHAVQAWYYAGPSKKSASAQDDTDDEIPISESNQRVLTTLLFPSPARTNTKKLMTFKRTSPFSLFMEYRDDPDNVRGIEKGLFETKFVNVEDAVKNLTDRGAKEGEVLVRAAVQLSESGFVSVKDAVAVGTVDSIIGKLLRLYVTMKCGLTLE